jgi:RND family efflux transporter MFP subunit
MNRTKPLWAAVIVTACLASAAGRAAAESEGPNNPAEGVIGPAMTSLVGRGEHRPAADEQDDAGSPIEAITRPSKDATLSFVGAGRIAEVLVEEGNAVTAGDVLVRQDDTAERLRLQQLKLEAEDRVQIQAAEARLRQSKVKLQKLEEAFKGRAATMLQVQEQRLEVRIAELSRDLANHRHTLNELKHKEIVAQVERMRLVSPIDGVVEDVQIEAGEAADALQEIVRVVRVDPLWIDVPVPTARAVALRPGGEARVHFPTGGEAPVTGRIAHVGAVADAASGRLTVRVEVPNPDGRPAGQVVKVEFPGPALTQVKSPNTKE